MELYTADFNKLVAISKSSVLSDEKNEAFQILYTKCLHSLLNAKTESKNQNGEIYRPLVEQLRSEKATWDSKFKKFYFRRYKIVDPTVSDVDAEKMFCAKIKPDDFSQQVMIGENIRLQDLVDSLEDRKIQLLKLEESVLSCRQDFVTLSILVETQQAAIDNTSKSIDSTTKNVDKGKVFLDKAKKSQGNSRKKQVGICMCLLALLLVILAPLISLKQF